MPQPTAQVPKNYDAILLAKEAYQQAKASADQWVTYADRLRDEVIGLMEEDDSAELWHDGEKVVSITWYDTERIDTKALREQFPDVARDFSKTTKQRRVTIK